jgi:hypothetical protein
MDDPTESKLNEVKLRMKVWGMGCSGKSAPDAIQGQGSSPDQ